MSVYWCVCSIHLAIEAQGPANVCDGSRYHLPAQHINGFDTGAAATSVVGRRNPFTERRTGASLIVGAFFTSAMRYGGRMWASLGSTGILSDRFPTPCTTASNPVGRIDGGSLFLKGAVSMGSVSSVVFFSLRVFPDPLEIRYLPRLSSHAGVFCHV